VEIKKTIKTKEKVLIAGANSYVGNHIGEYLSKSGYSVSFLDMRNDGFRDIDFRGYDVVFYVAGIAHNSNKKSLENLYYSVNRDLTIEFGQIAKSAGIKHFIYMSSIIVYGDSPVNGHISSSTIVNPKNHYGKSKCQAEIGLVKLNNSSFKTLILRSPMIYGEQSKGNYNLLSKFAKYMPIFPRVDNKRSMIYIGNLSEFIRIAINDRLSGVEHPQNPFYISTSRLVKTIRNGYGKKIWLTKIFNPLISVLSKITIIQKVFGNLYIDFNIGSVNPQTYCLFDYDQSIKLSEKRNL